MSPSPSISREADRLKRGRAEYIIWTKWEIDVCARGAREREDTRKLESVTMLSRGRACARDVWWPFRAQFVKIEWTSRPAGNLLVGGSLVSGDVSVAYGAADCLNFQRMDKSHGEVD